MVHGGFEKGASTTKTTKKTPALNGHGFVRAHSATVRASTLTRSIAEVGTPRAFHTDQRSEPTQSPGPRSTDPTM